MEKGLDPASRTRLIVLCAPPGYGKSTALAAAASRLDSGFAYLRVNSAENDPIRFWNYVAASLAQSYSPLGERSRSLLANAAVAGAIGGSKDTLQAPFLTSLLNEIAGYQAPVVLAVDDYHRIESEAVHVAFASFILELPPNARAVVASRTEPPLRLSALRARGELVEIDVSTLSFTTAETADYLRGRVGTAPKRPIDLGRFHRVFEGWPAGLHMAALSVESNASLDKLLQASGADNRYIAEFLTDEILLHQNQTVRELLFATSILGVLTSPVCSKVCGRAVSSEELEDLARRGLFVIREDQAGTVFRYHHLFAELLQKRLHREKAPEYIAGLHRIAACAYRDEGLPSEAIEHAFEAGDTKLTAELLGDYAIELLNHGRHGHILSYLERLPETAVEEHPQLAVATALVLSFGGHLDRARRLLAIARESVEGQSQEAPARKQTLGVISLIEALAAVFRNDLPTLHHESSRALELLPRHATVWKLAAVMVSGDASFLHGKLDDAYGAYTRTIEWCRRDKHPFFFMVTALRLLRLSAYRGHLRRMDSLAREFLAETARNSFANTAREGQIWGLYSRVARERLELDAALERAQRAAELAEGHTSLLVFGLTRQWLAGAHFARGEYEACRRVLDEADHHLARTPIANVTFLLLAWRLRLDLAIADGNRDGIDEAIRLAAAHGLTHESQPDVLRERALFGLVRLLRAAGQPERAEALLSRLERFCSASQLMPAAMEGRLIRCTMAEDRGDRPAALAELSVAVRTLAPEGYIYPFAAEGRNMVKLLYALLKSPGAPPQTAALVSALSNEGHPSAGGGRSATIASPADSETTNRERSRPPAKDAPIEALSTREVEVLRLVSEGMSNQQIADRLFVSLNTVKWHTGNIYGKLGVEGRTSAVMRSRDLGLIG